ncbi:MAG: permease [Granulosicoccus sp.]
MNTDQLPSLKLPTIKDLLSIKLDRAWLAVLLILLALLVLDTAQLIPTVKFALSALASTLPYIVFAILLIAGLSASGAESVIATAFEGRETRMIFFAALLGGLAPFCSCEVIPFVAGLLAVGTPLSAVMAFWLASPLIDPPSLLITAGALGWHFAIMKMVFAVSVGLMGGFVIKTSTSLGAFADPLRKKPSGGCSSCGSDPFSGKPVWKFWHDPARMQTFRHSALENMAFLLKWLSLAYVLESLLIVYVPAESIAGLVGGQGVLPIVISALVGVPAYLNSYAAPPLVSGLIDQGMTAGAGMAFMVAGAVSSIPAMTAVFALVKKEVFAAYAILGLTGAVLSGLIYSAVL